MGPGLFVVELGSGKVEFTDMVTIEIVASEQDDSCDLQCGDFAPGE